MVRCTLKKVREKKMKQKFFIISIVCIFFLCIPVLIMADSDLLLIGNEENSVILNKSAVDYARITYTTGSLVKTSCSIEGKTLYTIHIPGEGTILLKGEPDLPEISRSICITGESTITLRILETDYIDIPMDIAPSKGSLLRTVNPDDVPYEFSKTYSKNEFYPATPAEINEPYIFRDLTGVTINVHPCAYNPARNILRVYTKIVLEAGTDQENETRSVLPASTSRVFDTMYENHFLNYTPAPPTRMNETGSILVICHDDFTSAIQPYVDWKRQIGFNVTMTPISSIGNTVSTIKNYITQQYETIPDLAFVQLVGDAEYITGYALYDEGAGITISDTYYTWISGNDAYPELIIGRFSAESPGDVTTQVNKTIYYERDMQDAAWLARATGIASIEGPGDDDEYDWQHLRNIRSGLIGYQFTQVDEFYDGSQGGSDASGNPTDTMVANALNDGRSLINYTGHGKTDRWITSNFTSSDVNALQNNNKLPFIFSVACLVGKLNGTTCFAETWLRAANGGSGTGAVAMFGAPISQPWLEPMRAQDAFTDLFIREQGKTFGALCFTACAKMLDEGGSAGYTFRGWMIFGDASLQISRSVQSPTPVPTPSPTTEPAGNLGDVNGNGTIDIVDALLTAQYYVGLDPSGFDPAKADTDCDGSVDIIDALLIAQYYVGLITEFCVVF
jgi:hypothetical protein